MCSAAPSAVCCPCPPSPQRSIRAGWGWRPSAEPCSAAAASSAAGASSSTASSSSSSAATSVDASVDAASFLLPALPSRTPALSSIASQISPRVDDVRASSAAARAAGSRGARASLSARRTSTTGAASAGARCLGSGAPTGDSAPPAADRLAHGPVDVLSAAAQSPAVTRSPLRLVDAWRNASLSSLACAAHFSTSWGATGTHSIPISTPSSPFPVDAALAWSCAKLMPSRSISIHLPTGVVWYPGPPKKPFPGLSTTRTELFHLRVPFMPQWRSHRAGSCHDTLCLFSLVATSHGPHRHRIMPCVPCPGWNMPHLFLHTTMTGFSSSVGGGSGLQTFPLETHCSQYHSPVGMASILRHR